MPRRKITAWSLPMVPMAQATIILFVPLKNAALPREGGSLKKEECDIHSRSQSKYGLCINDDVESESYVYCVDCSYILPDIWYVPDFSYGNSYAND